jgi:arylsulfatase A-like enzyme
MKYPNILLITSDQLRINEIEFMSPDSAVAGKPNTPNLDAMAARGTSFGLCITPSPVCTPARTSLFSGQYPSRCMGPVINAPEPVAERVVFPDETLPELLARHGYKTALVGKWHIHTRPQSVGFAECAFPNIFHLNRDQWFNFTDGSNRKIEGCAYEFELAEAERFLSRRPDRPFFMSHNISLPHMPFFDVDEFYRYMYTPGEVAEKLPGNAFPPDDAEFFEKWQKIYYYDAQYYKYRRPDCAELPPALADGTPRERLAALYAMYRGMIAACDAQVGRLIDMLYKYGHADDTIMIFTSDHGDNMGSHGIFNKDVSYDESTRIPLIIEFGKNVRPAGAVRNISDVPVSLIDIMPTIANLIGSESPQCDGISLMPLISGSEIARKHVFTETPLGEFAYRDARYLYSIKTDVHSREIKDDSYLFIDTKRDPLALDNIASRERTPEEEAEMARLRGITVAAHNAKHPGPRSELSNMR